MGVNKSSLLPNLGLLVSYAISNADPDPEKPNQCGYMHGSGTLFMIFVY
jgi:hypothetical protein